MSFHFVFVTNFIRDKNPLYGTCFAENQIVFWDFKIKNSIQITEGLDNGDLDNRGSTVLH